MLTNRLLDFSEENFKKIKQELFNLLKKKSVLRGDFTLASGQKSNYYLDTRLTPLDPEGISLISYLLFYILKDEEKNIDVIAGPVLGACPIVTGLCQFSYFAGKNWRSAYIRKEAKNHGTGKLIEGCINKQDNIYMLEDVITTASSVIKSINILRQNNFETKNLACLILRDPAGKRALENHGVKVKFLFTPEEFLN